MEYEEALDILKQGVEIWNQWKKEYMAIVPPSRFLPYPSFTKDNLSEFDLSEADLSSVNLSEADLSGANLQRANLSRSLLIGTNLRGAFLDGTNLRGADLRGADLYRTNFIECDLNGAYVNDALVEWTVFVNIDLSKVEGLQMVRHQGPLSIGIDTIYRSEGMIPEVFLRNAGVPETYITYMRSLIIKPIDYYSCFISYSSKDEAFAKRLYADLQSLNVRCWFAPEDLKIGDKIRPRIEESIRLYDKLLLVLSEHSIASNWVSYEVERALNKEPEGIPNVLFPIRLDDTVMKSKAGWADDIRRTRHIGDFCNWKDHDDYQKAFARLLRDLKSESV